MKNAYPVKLPVILALLAVFVAPVAAIWYSGILEMNFYGWLSIFAPVRTGLDLGQVLEIIDLLKTTTLGNQEIAKEYNVSENTICGINTGYYWFQDNIDYPIRKKHQH